MKLQDNKEANLGKKQTNNKFNILLINPTNEEQSFTAVKKMHYLS